MVDLEFGKGGFQYAVTARVGCLLGGVGACPPQENFLISDLLRSFLVYSWGEIAKVGRPILLNLIVVFEVRRIKGVTPLRAAEAAGLISA